MDPPGYPGHRIPYRTLTMKKNSFLFYLILFSSCLFFLTGCQRNAVETTKTGFYLNTVVSITLYNRKEDDPLFDEAMSLIGEYDSLLSKTAEGSDIYRINHAGGSPVEVDERTAELLSIALSYASLSDGLVDPTIGTLSDLWNFGDTNEGIVPHREDIEEALSHIDYTKVKLSGNTVTLLDPDARLDLGFIAKGYIADKLKAYLTENGVTNGIINLGGNVLTIGTKPDGSDYHIGVQKPFAETGTALTTLTVSDRSLVSSGNYERYFEKDGILYHHILSTKDGYPVNSGLNGVTIISKNSVDGDALSTLCFILGYEKGRKLIDSLPDTEAVFINDAGELITG